MRVFYVRIRTKVKTLAGENFMGPIVQSAKFSGATDIKSVHYHDSHQIIYILNGEVDIHINGRDERAREGDVVIFSRYENHSLTVLSEKYERYVLRIGARVSSVTSDAYTLLFNRPIGFSNVFSVGNIKSEILPLFEKITNELASPDDFSERVAELLAEEIIISLRRACPERFGEADRDEADIVYSLERKFDNDPKTQYTLEQLAKDYHISPSSLSHQFKRITGFSVFEYLYMSRIALAKYYLARTAMSIGEIVEECGFCDNSNFSRSFKGRVGMTPSEFRKNYRSVQ